MVRTKTTKTDTPGIRKDTFGRFWICAKISGKTHWELVGKKTDAIRKLRNLRNEADAKRNDLSPIRRTSYLLADLFDRYRTEDENVNKTSDRNEAYEEKWTEALGEVYADEISVRTVTDQQSAWLAEGYEPATINRYCSRIKRVFSQAARDGLIADTLIGMPKLKEPPSRFRVLTREEEPRLLAELAPWARPFVLFALFSGCRQAEQFNLRSSQVDLSARRIWIGDRTKPNEGRMLSMGNTFQAIAAEQAAIGHKFLFPNRSRTNAERANNFMRRHFVPALERAGIEELVWHDLRRTCGSRLAEAGARTRSIQRWLGHKNIKTTEGYMQISQDHLSEIADLQG